MFFLWKIFPKHLFWRRSAHGCFLTNFTKQLLEILFPDSRFQNHLDLQKYQLLSNQRFKHNSVFQYTRQFAYAGLKTYVFYVHKYSEFSYFHLSIFPCSQNWKQRFKNFRKKFPRFPRYPRFRSFRSGQCKHKFDFYMIFGFI